MSTLRGDLRDALREIANQGVVVDVRSEGGATTCRLSVSGHALSVVSPGADDAVERALRGWRERRWVDRGKAATDPRGDPDGRVPHGA